MMCRDVVEHTTDASEGALRGLKRLSYRFHLLICPYCRCHTRQMATTVAALRALPRPTAPEEGLETALKAFKNKNV